MGGNQQIVDKILSDSKFCEELTADPEKTLQSLGVDATPEAISALNGLDAASLQRLASAFGKQTAAA